MSANSFDARGELEVGRAHLSRSSGSTRSQPRFDVARLPFSLKVLLENLLRTEDGGSSRADDIEALAELGRRGRARAARSRSRRRACCMQDFTGVPAVVDLAAMRDAMRATRRRPDEDQPARRRPSW